jgi:hypothetical protein
VSQRPGFLVTERRYAPAPPWRLDLPDPRSQVPEVTVEIRAHWPYWADRATVLAALDAAYRRAVLHATTTIDETTEPNT